GTLAVAPLATEATGTTSRDARDEDTVADVYVLHARADLFDAPHRLVADDAAVDHRQDVALQDVQVRAADRGRVDPHDRVGVGRQRRAGHLLPGLVPGTVVNERLHVLPPS